MSCLAVHCAQLDTLSVQDKVRYDEETADDMKDLDAMLDKARRRESST